MTVILYRVDVEEILKDGVLVGYMDFKGDIPKAYMLNTYDIIIQEPL